MKRLVAVAAFLIGGIATVLAHPAQCPLVTPGRMQIKRKNKRKKQ